MVKTQIGTNPDGTPRFNYAPTAEECAQGLVFFKTPVMMQGEICLAAAGNATYDLTEHYIAVKPEHVEHLHAAIDKAHHAAGRFLDVPVPDLGDVSLPDA